jgi:hypothetical protein
MPCTLILSSHVLDDCVLIAGVLGYKVVGQGTENGLVSLEPAHGWAMMLPPDSPLRRK